MRRVLPLVLVAVMALPSPAEACSCGRFSELTAKGCAASKRVFGGTVAGYTYPNQIEEVFLYHSFQSVTVKLDVDRVWKGSVRDQLFTSTGMGGGDCGIHPDVGTRFVVCDDGDADDPPEFEFCESPAFEPWVLQAELGAPTGPGPESLAWWRVGLRLLSALGIVTLVIRRRRRRHPEPSQPQRS